VDAVNLAGKTPLHVACAWGQEQVVEAACMLGGIMWSRKCVAATWGFLKAVQIPEKGFAAIFCLNPCCRSMPKTWKRFIV